MDIMPMRSGGWGVGGTVDTLSERLVLEGVCAWLAQAGELAWVMAMDWDQGGGEEE